ncbi:arginine ABC transporter ATP-binding protein [Actinoplanes sp. OR16]|uniref:amino acid ABC transporter ATP-binding protein n=1 Tax=Actinoplanes sp. OR16 TaxID=946334 RepID=UPI000F6BF55F|nr:amino acid ABC transporter ATP-binding protein [Actinoplanes sp. OR16]BBH68383.1 arginine ABC transporter ATP-binding protein [Actinoplanes sp. OR16]
MKTPPLLQVQNLHKSYNDVAVLGGVDFTVQRGQVKALLGPSGSGKSTILRLISLLEPADSGTILLDGEPIGLIGGRLDMRPAPERVLARQRTAIGMVFQKFNLFPHLDATRNVMAGLTTVLKVPKKEAREQALAMLERVGLAGRAHAYPSELSGGQQQRVAIARALVMKPKLMLFDEPTSALDPELVREVLDVMEKLASDGMTMVVVTHEMRFARSVASEVALFDSGQIVEQAPPDRFFDAPEHERTRRFLAHMH